MFEVGDKVVHPQHGAGVVTRREARVVLGEEREYLTIHIPLTDLLLNVPADGAEAVGVRRVIGEDVLDDLARTLTSGDVELEGNWNRRFRRNRDKIKTGNVLEIAEVIRAPRRARSRPRPLERRAPAVRPGQAAAGVRGPVRARHGRGRGAGLDRGRARERVVRAGRRGRPPRIACGSGRLPSAGSGRPGGQLKLIIRLVFALLGALAAAQVAAQAGMSHQFSEASTWAAGSASSWAAPLSAG